MRLLQSVYQQVFRQLSSQDSWWQKPLLRITTDWASGPWLGMGLELKKLDDSSCYVRMPARWKNEDLRQGEIHGGAVLTLGEYCARLYWERLFLGTSTKMQVTKAEIKFLKTLDKDLIAQLQYGSADREQILFLTRSQQRVDHMDFIPIYNSAQQLVAEVSLEWQFHSHIQKELPSRKSE
jgi:hypothetical protein